jgi:hypothetical protein
MQPRPQLRHSLHHSHGFDVARTAVELDEDYASRARPAREDEFSKVAVLGDDHSPLAHCELQHVDVGHTLGELGDGETSSASRKAEITSPAQLSSARNFTLQGSGAAGTSESSTTSSWATLAAP